MNNLIILHGYTNLIDYVNMIEMYTINDNCYWELISRTMNCLGTGNTYLLRRKQRTRQLNKLVYCDNQIGQR